MISTGRFPPSVLKIASRCALYWSIEPSAWKCSPLPSSAIRAMVSRSAPAPMLTAKIWMPASVAARDRARASGSPLSKTASTVAASSEAASPVRYSSVRASYVAPTSRMMRVISLAVAALIANVAYYWGSV